MDKTGVTIKILIMQAWIIPILIWTCPSQHNSMLTDQSVNNEGLPHFHSACPVDLYIRFYYDLLMALISKPNWSIESRLSAIFQRSFSFPPSKWRIVIVRMLMRLFATCTPKTSPENVPVLLMRNTTLSFSAIM